MEMLKLALKSNIPLIYVKTDDILNIEEILSHLAGTPVKPMNVPQVIEKISDLKVPQGNYFYTSNKCESLVKLYHFCREHSLTVVFVNTEKSVVQFDGGVVVPPKELIRAMLEGITENPDELLPAYGGMTLKDAAEVSQMTMTRDESLTLRGVNKTRGGYNNLKGITQVDTTMNYYVQPSYLTEWLSVNSTFFMSPVHASLSPRGLLFDGPPGTGKSAAAKAIAQSFGVPLYRLDVGAMKDMYVGNSEANLLSALAQVDQVEPCVVLFDEVEKVFQSQHDSGVTSSMLSQLLWWLQEHKSKVFSVMTTNDRTKIPPELYREGRVDQVMMFLGVEGFVEGYKFAKGAFDSMLEELGGTAVAENFSELNKRVKTLYADEAAVPQSKLTSVAYGLVREILASKEQ